MKIEKILMCVLGLLFILCGVVYFTLPEQGEQIYIPPVQNIPAEVEIPDGYKLVENFNDVYYVETENGIRYYWLMKFENGTYGWQEVDKDGNIIFPNRETEPPSESKATDAAKKTTFATEPAKQPLSEPTE